MQIILEHFIIHIGTRVLYMDVKNALTTFRSEWLYLYIIDNVKHENNCIDKCLYYYHYYIRIYDRNMV